MENLLKSAQSFTVKNIVKSRKSKKSVNDFIMELMIDGKPIERIQLNMQIALKRIELSDESITEKMLIDAFETASNEKLTMSDEQQEVINVYQKYYTTAKNGVDQSVARGQQKSNFCNSEYSAEYDLIKVGSKLKLVKIKK